MIARSTEALCARFGNRMLGKATVFGGRPHNKGGHITWIMFPGT